MRRRVIVICTVAGMGGACLVGLSASQVAGDGIGMKPLVVVNSGNVSTTRRYLEEARATLITMNHDSRQVDRAIRRVVQATRSGCSGIAVGGLQSRDSWLIKVGITESLAVTAGHAYSAIESRFRDAVKRLRWSNVQLTDLVQRAAEAETLLSRRKAPGPCAYLMEWARSRFERAPRALTVFSREVAGLSEMSDLFPSALRKYEGTSLAEKAREVVRLERAVAIGLKARILRGRINILNAVGLVSNGAARGSTSFDGKEDLLAQS